MTTNNAEGTAPEVVVWIPGPSTARYVEMHDTTGGDLDDDAWFLGREAFRQAADEAGGNFCGNEDDLSLDQEGPGGDLNLAVGIIVTTMALAGYRVRTLVFERCMGCNDPSDRMNDEVCTQCGGRGVVERRGGPGPAR